MDSWEQQSEKQIQQKAVHNNQDVSVVEVKNAITGETMFILKSKLNEFNHRIEKDGTIVFLPGKRPDKSHNERGCLIFIFLFITSLAILGGFIIKKELKANKHHINTISGIYQDDKRIIISDVNTKEERLIEYNGYKDKFAKQNQLPDFEEQVNKSKVGDTVIFVSPDYETRRKFVLDEKNRLHLNKDSIIMRTIRNIKQK